MGSPEQPTLIERFVRLIPLKYPLAALAWTIILGPVGFRLVNYLSTGTSPFGSPNPLNEIFGLLLTFYVYYIVGYLRLKVVAAESQIAPIMSGGEGTYDSLFGRLTSNIPIILLATFLDALAILVTDAGSSLPLQIYNRINQFILFVAFATVIWEYSVSSWSLHRLGETQLRLKSFLENRFLGASAIGNLALSLTIAYLGGLLLFFFDASTFLSILTPQFIAFILVFLGLGVVMFFLPLNSVHRKMQREKTDRKRELNQQFLAVVEARQIRSHDG